MALPEVPLSQLAEVNPQRSIPAGIARSDAVSFVPMADVSDSARWVTRQTRPLRACLQGFTPFVEGDVLFAKITPCMENGKGAHALGLVSGVGFGSTEFHALRARPGVSSRFIYHWSVARLLRLRAETFMSGSAGQQRVDARFFDNFLVPKLAEGEQRRVAEVLDTLDEAIQKTEQVIDKLKQMKQGLLHDLLTRGIDENGELRDPERHPEQFKQTGLGGISRTWEVARCEAVCREITVGIVVKPTQYYRESGIPVLRSANVREHGVVMADLKFMSPKDHSRMAKSAVRPGDLVTVRTGYPGTTAVVAPEVTEANCVDIIITRPGPTVVAEYLATWVNSDFGKGQVLSRQGGLAQQHFNVGEMKELAIALPPLAEQQRISAVLRSTSDRISSEELTVSKLRRLKLGLMEDLLTGRVRVTEILEGAAV